MMTAISAISDHYGLKLFATVLSVHTVGQNLFSRHDSLQGRCWRRESLGIWENQVANRWSESPVCSPMSLLLPLP